MSVDDSPQATEPGRPPQRIAIAATITAELMLAAAGR
jgi:hypothetical protein